MARAWRPPRPPEVRRKDRGDLLDMTWAELTRRLEDTWSPDGDTFLLPKSVGASALKDGAVGSAAIARFRPQWRGLGYHEFWTAYAYGDSDYAPGYTRSPSGWVDLRGLITKPGVAWTVDDPAAYLPRGFRPGTARVFPALVASGAGFGVARITVFASGDILFGGTYAGSANSWDPNNWVSLDAIGFWAEG